MVKKRSFLKKSKQKKSNPLPHRKKFHDFYFEEKKIPNYYYILAYLSSYQTLL